MRIGSAASSIAPMGELLNFGRGGFTSVYEGDLFIQIEQGVFVSEQVVVNGDTATSVVVRAAPANNAEDKSFNFFHKKNRLMDVLMLHSASMPFAYTSKACQILRLIGQTLLAWLALSEWLQLDLRAHGVF